MSNSNRVSTISYPPWLNPSLLLVLMIVIGSIWSYYTFAPRSTSSIDRQGLLTEVEHRLTQHRSDIARETRDLAAITLPPLTRALAQELRQDYPLFLKRLTREGETLGAHAEELILNELATKSQAYVEEHRLVLAEEFPEYADAEALKRLESEMQRTLQNVAQRYYLDEYRQAAEQTSDLWVRFEPVPAPADNEPPLASQLNDYVADWMVLAFKDEATQALGSP